MNLMGVTEEHHTSKKKIKKSTFKKKTYLDETSDVTHHGTSIVAGGNVGLNAIQTADGLQLFNSGDVTLEGAEISAGGDLTAYSQGVAEYAVGEAIANSPIGEAYEEFVSSAGQKIGDLAMDITDEERQQYQGQERFDNKQEHLDKGGALLAGVALGTATGATLVGSIAAVGKRKGGDLDSSGGNNSPPSNASMGEGDDLYELIDNAGKVKSDTPLQHELYKQDLERQNIENIASYDSRLNNAVNGNVNFGIGRGSSSEANDLGRVWVGDGAIPVKNQKDCPGCMKSADGTRIYRPPTVKKNTPEKFNPTGVQANFVTLDKQGKIIGNGHLIID